MQTVANFLYKRRFPSFSPRNEMKENSTLTRLHIGLAHADRSINRFNIPSTSDLFYVWSWSLFIIVFLVFRCVSLNNDPPVNHPSPTRLIDSSAATDRTRSGRSRRLGNQPQLPGNSTSRCSLDASSRHRAATRVSQRAIGPQGQTRSSARMLVSPRGVPQNLAAVPGQCQMQAGPRPLLSKLS